MFDFRRGERSGAKSNRCLVVVCECFNKHWQTKLLYFVGQKDVSIFIAVLISFVFGLVSDARCEEHSKLTTFPPTGWK